MSFGHHKLSRLQQSMWLSEQKVGPSSLWNVTLELRIKGRIELGHLKAALEEVVNRHAILRIRVGEENSVPFQWVSTAAMPTVHDLTTLPHADALFQEQALALAQRPFAIGADPPLRTDVYKLAPEDHAVLFRFHHIATDGHSCNLLIEDLASIYRCVVAGGVVVPQSPTLSYLELIDREAKPEYLERLSEGGAYWERALAGAPSAIDLRRSTAEAEPNREGAFVRFVISGSAAAGLIAIAKENGTGVPVAFLACLQALAARLTATEDLIVGLTVNGRASSDVKRVQGLFANVLPIRARIDWSQVFDVFLRQQRDVVREALRWQDIPLEEIIERCNPPRTGKRHPFVRVSLNYWSPNGKLFDVEGVEASYRRIEIAQARYELTLKVTRTGDSFDCTFEYDRNLFSHDEVVVFAKRLTRLIEGLPLLRAAPLRLQRFLLAEEEERLGIPALPPAVPPLVDMLIDDSAERDPDAVAILHGSKSITRRTLHQQADRLAARLIELGVGQDAPVALPLPRGAEMIVAQLATIKTGACFIPLDPSHPPDRLRVILQASRVRAIVALDDFALEGDNLPPLIRLDAQDAAIFAPSERVDAKITAGQLAYVIYTSGSTGEPKGVMVEHGSLANMVSWYHRAHRISACDRVSMLAAPGFDSTIYEVWPALCAGSVLVPAPEHLTADAEAVRKWLVSMEINVAFAPTPLGELLMRQPWPDDTKLRTLQIGGDRLSARPPAGLPFRVVNSYGPAEGTVVSSEGDVEPIPAASIPDIGRAITGVELLVLDGEGVAVPDGVPGDLHLCGPNLARGYLGRPDLTAERFFVHPLYGGRRLYRTGDIARRRQDDGRFECLGRLDRQVKVRGQRLEIGEIEHALTLLEDVDQAVVLYSPGLDGTGELTAYLVSREAPDPVKLRSSLRRTLPIAAIPARFIRIERMPLTRNGKIDQDELARQNADPRSLSGETSRINLKAVIAGLGRRPIPAADLVGDAERLEEQVFRAWRDVLGIDDFSRHDDFFDLGGHSLMAVRVVARLRAATGIDLTMRAFFRHPTVATLAAWMDKTVHRSLLSPGIEA